MAQHDYSIANQSGASFRSDLNNALSAIVSQNSGTAEPSTTYAYQMWADTTNGVMKLRNAANNAWITLYQLDGEWSVIPFENGSAAAPSIYFKDSGTDTGFFSAGTDQVNVTTGGTERVEWGTSEVVFNDSGANYDFRVEGDTNANLLFVDASADAVGIGTASPSSSWTQTNQSTASISAGIALFDSAGTNKGQIGLAGAGTGGDSSRLWLNGKTDVLLNIDGTEAARIDSSRRLLVGTSSSLTTKYVTSGFEPGFQNAANVGTGGFFRYSADADGPAFVLSKSRNTSTGSHTVVNSGDTVGYIGFAGSDGTDFETAATIKAEVDGTPGNNDMPGRLVFSTTADGASSPTERMRIRSNGEIQFGSGGGTNPSLGFYPDSAGGYFLKDTNSTNSRTHFYFQISGTTVGTITTSGSATAYNTSSDYRLKENVVPVADGITRLQQLKPSRFNFIADPDRTVDGFIAHEVQTVVPEAIHGTKDEVDADGNPIYQGIDQSKLVPLLTAALQEAVAKIESLEARLTAAGI